ncbi:MAG TPA: GrpB family protein [Nocardioides sp.]|nr:GrpB family protein [Nocardioides sp.]
MLALEHVGSTAIPGLWAKPVIDVGLVVSTQPTKPPGCPTWNAPVSSSGSGYRTGWSTA